MPSPEQNPAQEIDDAFTRLAAELLSQGAHTMRGLTEEQYVTLAGSVWQSCEKDDVYAIKILVDPVAQPQFREDSSDGLFCVLVARIGHGGELIDAPRATYRQVILESSCLTS